MELVPPLDAVGVGYSPHHSFHYRCFPNVFSFSLPTQLGVHEEEDKIIFVLSADI